jgi:hypothetical protein
LRSQAHDSGPGWLAGPSLYGSFIRYSPPVFTGALPLDLPCLLPFFDDEYDYEYEDEYEVEYEDENEYVREAE